MFDTFIDDAIKKWAYLLTEEEKITTKLAVQKAIDCLKEGTMPANLRVMHSTMELLIPALMEFFAPVKEEEKEELESY